MENLYKILLVPSKENLHLHAIHYFDRLIDQYPKKYRQIITYINECFNYHSPFLVEEKDWTTFLHERYEASTMPADFIDDVVNYKAAEIVIAIDEFLTHQKQPVFQTLAAKQNLRKDMLVFLQDPANKINDKQTANTLLTTLDDEINTLHERLRQEQKVFGNYKGFDAVKQARTVTQLNIAMM